MKQFISAQDAPNINALVSKALDYKANPFKDKTLGVNKRIGLLFFNPSMRTRLSTQIAAQNLGMECIMFNVGSEGWNLEFDDDAMMNGLTVEHIKDAAPILGNYFDILCIRTFPSLKDRSEDYSEKYINQLIKYSGIPVVSLESATLHPLQSLTDIATIKETFLEKRKPRIVLSWAPHIKPLPQCVANSFSQWVTQWGEADFIIAHPEGYDLDPMYTQGATIINNHETALQNADYVYVKNWSSYTDYGKIKSYDNDWMITKEKLHRAKDAKIMHCLPVRRNLELGGDVLDSKNSLTTLQGTNRIYAAQAVLSEILHPSI